MGEHRSSAAAHRRQKIALWKGAEREAGGGRRPRETPAGSDGALSKGEARKSAEERAEAQ